MFFFRSIIFKVPFCKFKEQDRTIVNKIVAWYLWWDVSLCNVLVPSSLRYRASLLRHRYNFVKICLRLSYTRYNYVLFVSSWGSRWVLLTSSDLFSSWVPQALLFGVKLLSRVRCRLFFGRYVLGRCRLALCIKCTGSQWSCFFLTWYFYKIPQKGIYWITVTFKHLGTISKHINGATCTFYKVIYYWRRKQKVKNTNNALRPRNKRSADKQEQMKRKVLNLCRSTGINGLQVIEDITSKTGSFTLPEAILLRHQYGANHPRR